MNDMTQYKPEYLEYTEVPRQLSFLLTGLYNALPLFIKEKISTAYLNVFNCLWSVQL